VRVARAGIAMGETPRVNAGEAAGSAALHHAFDLANDPDAGAPEVEFHRARLAADGPTLVAMCGIGRLLVPLAATGAALHGVDSSPIALDLCEARLRERGLAALLVRQPLDELNLAFRYHAAFLPGGALQRIVDPTRALEGLRRIAAHLVAPAMLVAEFVIPAEAQHAPGAPLVEVRAATDTSGARIVWRSETRVDVEGRRVDRIDRFEKRVGREIVAREDAKSAFTWYAEDEIAPLLGAAGFFHIEVEPARWQQDGGARWLVAAAHV
jgi:hypothetical protein